MSGDLRRYDTQVLEVSGSCPDCQSGYRSGDPIKLRHLSLGGQ